MERCEERKRAGFGSSEWLGVVFGVVEGEEELRVTDDELSFVERGNEERGKHGVGSSGLWVVFGRERE